MELSAAKGSQRGRLSMAARMLIPTLMCAVALTQMSAALWSTLTPWKGGGFGMFSTLDTPARRFVSITATDPAGNRYHVRVPSFAEPRALTSTFRMRLLSFPSRTKMSELAAAVLASRMIGFEQGPPELPTRLRSSPSYEAALSDSLAQLHGRLEVSSPYIQDPPNRPTARQIAAVRVGLYRLKFSYATRSARLEELSVGGGVAASIASAQSVPLSDGRVGDRHIGR